MKHSFSLLFLLFVVIETVCGQAQMTTSGNWATATNWSGNNIGDAVTETVTFGNGIDPTINNLSSFTTGSITFGNNNTLTVNTGGTLNVGDASHANNITSGNGTTITVAGTLVIWGNLVVNNNITWNITGTVIVKGNVTLGNGADLTVTGGTLQVNGNFTGGNNTSISVPSGSITVGQAVTVGNGSTLAGCAGCFHSGGACTGPSTFCSNSVMPITLASFNGKVTGTSITLDWSTVSELNFDRFAVERMDNDNFIEIGSVAGNGTSQHLIQYSFEDQTPMIGANFYRLRSIDFDGTSKESPIIRVNFTDTKLKVTLYPNPVTGDAFNVMTNFSRKDGDMILIYDNMGERVGETTVDRNGARISNVLTEGIYTLWYVSGETRCMTRFVVK